MIEQTVLIFKPVSCPSLKNVCSVLKKDQICGPYLQIPSWTDICQKIKSKFAETNGMLRKKRNPNKTSNYKCTLSTLYGSSIGLKMCGSGYSAITLLTNLSCKSCLFFSEIGHKYEV